MHAVLFNSCELSHNFIYMCCDKNGKEPRDFEGVSQGCCISPRFFVLIVELLAQNIKHNEEIKGMLRDSTINDDL